MRQVTSGVPQGSILGPLVFLLFINDLPETLSEVSSYGYTDDFKAIVLNQDQLNSAKGRLENWLESNGMLPNIKKSTLLSIRSNLRATLMRHPLTTVKEQRDLGLNVSSNLNWDENGSHRASKAMNALFNIKRNLTKNFSNETKVNAYTGYVVPIATYASPTWLSNRASAQKLESVQKVATRWILGSEKSYCDRRKILNLLPLSLLC